MDFNTISSKLLEKAVSEFSKLPGVGKRTALRHVLFLLKQDNSSVESFGQSIINLKNNIRFCSICHNISDSEICPVCSSISRDKSTICVIENINDLIAIENTHQYNGVYHVLGGIISPMDGIGPNDLNISSLEERVKAGNIKEIIFALSATMEGDTTNFYLYRKLFNENLRFTALARGVAVGNDLEYTDEVTLARSIKSRTVFEINH
jgi:recombination protein RecR